MIDNKDITDDLTGDIIPEINPETLFDEKQYATIILGNENASKKDIDNSNLAAILISNKTSREEKDEALNTLKANNAKDFLLKAIANTKKAEHKAILIAACWETGMDYSKDFKVFFNLIGHENFHVSFEALTVIEEMEGLLSQTDLQEAQTILNSFELDNHGNIEAANNFITQHLNSI